MHLLIVKLGSIGDIIHTLPALAAIRRELPGAEISWVVEERSAEMLRGNELIDNLIEVDTRSLRGGMVVEEMLLSAGRQIKELRRFKFDISIDFQGLLKSAMIGKLSGAGRRWGFSKEGLREPASRLLLTDKVEVPSGIHIIRKNLALAAGALNIVVPDADFEFPITTAAEHVAEADAIIEAAQRGSPRVSEGVTLDMDDTPLLTRGLLQHREFAVLNPAGGWVTKLWHAEKFGALADRLWEEHGIASIVATGPQELELAEKVSG